MHILLLLCKATHLQGIPLQAIMNKLMATLLHKARRITLNELFTIIKWIMTPGLASVQNVQFLFVWIFLHLVSMMCKQSRNTFWALRRSTCVQYVCVLTYKALCCWCKIFGFCFLEKCRLYSSAAAAAAAARRLLSARTNGNGTSSATRILWPTTKSTAGACWGMVLTLTCHLSYFWILQRKKECFTQQVWETNREVIAITIQELAPW